MRFSSFISVLAILLLTSPAQSKKSQHYPGLAALEILQQDGFGDAFTVIDALYTLDGVAIHPKMPKDDSAAEGKPVSVYNGVMLPGKHVLAVTLRAKGDGTFFSYLENYKVGLAAKVEFYAARGVKTRLLVTTFDRGMSEEFSRRPGLDLKVVTDP